MTVNHVVNITDYDDKTIAGSGRAGQTLSDFTQGHLDQFKKDLSSLDIRKADAYPKVSDHFDDMTELAQQLQDGNFAYEKLYSLYFDISSLPEYGTFSNVDLEKIKVGATVDLDEYEKKNPKDFTLFKRVKLSELKRGVGIKTRWGNVRPSLHLQCAALAMKFFGETFDIQTGSRELIFPHHENEVAIARASKGAGLANFWLHCDPVHYDGSLGADSIDDLTLDLLSELGWDYKTIRFWLISNHYSKTLLLGKEQLSQAQATLDKMNRCMASLADLSETPQKNRSEFEDADQFIYDLKQAFTDAMADDLKISVAVSTMLAGVKTINRKIAENAIDSQSAHKLLKCYKALDAVLCNVAVPKKAEYSEQVQDLIRQRAVARENNDWERSDRIREELIAMGIEVQDRKQDK